MSLHYVTKKDMAYRSVLTLLQSGGKLTKSGQSKQCFIADLSRKMCLELKSELNQNGSVPLTELF